VLGDNLENTVDFRQVYATMIEDGSEPMRERARARSSRPSEMFRTS
jgi:hypothetical protein